VGRSPVEVDELVEHWTVLEDEQQLVAGKRGATRLGFALLLQFYTRLGRFPRGRSELPQEAVDSSLPVRCRWRPVTWAFTSGLVARSSITAPRSASIWATGSVASRMRRG